MQVLAYCPRPVAYVPATALNDWLRMRTVYRAQRAILKGVWVSRAHESGWRRRTRWQLPLWQVTSLTHDHLLMEQARPVAADVTQNVDITEPSRGRSWVLGDNIDTDVLAPGQYLSLIHI